MEFSKRKIIIQSWQALREHLGLWVFIMLFILCINIIIGTIQEKLLNDITLSTAAGAVDILTFMGVDASATVVYLNSLLNMS